jgi:class 3 adenylate cyclase/tetratricopeptide (TPR) repeat protein
MHSGERRQITALFCDLIDSVKLTNEMDPEEWLEVVDAYYGVAREIITSFKGRILDYVGDGIAAYFGYPLSDEEATCDAVKAALRLSEEIPLLETSLQVKLKSRIGVATGLVVIKLIELDGNHSKTSLIGETPNLAARLQAMAEANTVVISSTTKNIVDGIFECLSLGVHDFKGFSNPLEVFQVTQLKFAGSRSQIRTTKSRQNLYGREKEITRLEHHWSTASGGQTTFVLVKGEAGIGKTSLVQTLRNQLTMADEKHQIWLCSPNHALSALYPIVELIMRLSGFEPKDSQEERREKLNNFLHIFGVHQEVGQIVMAELLGLPIVDASAIKNLSPERKKEIRLQTITTLLETWSAGEPILIVVEDLHWVDNTTLELIDAIHANDRLASCMILGTARPEFQPMGKAPCSVIELESLKTAESLQLSQAIDSEHLITADLRRQIISRCDGNPLFIEEMTQSVIESLSTEKRNGKNDLTFVPETLQESLVARLDRLGEAKRLACVGAVIGRAFSKAIVIAVTNQSQDDVEASLVKLLDSGLASTVATSEGVSYQFKHALIRDSAYGILMKRDRQDLHRRTADILRHQFPGICDAEPQLLAYHFTESGAYDQAVPLWMLAGQRMAENAAHAEAVAHFQRALQLMKSQPESAGDPTSELQIHTGIAISLSASRGYSVPEVREALDNAELLARTIGDDHANFVVLRGICNFKIVDGDMDMAESTCFRCEAISKQTRRPEHEIETDTPFGYVYFTTGRLEEAVERNQHGISLYDKHQDEELAFPCPQDPKIVCLSALMMTYAAMGLEEKLYQAKQDLRSHMEKLDQPFQSAFGLMYLAWSPLNLKNHRESFEASRLCHILCDANGYTTHSGNSKFMAAAALPYLDPTKLDVAIRQAQEALALLTRLGCQHTIPSRLGEMAKLHAMAGDLDLARQMSREAVDMAKRIDDLYFIPVILCRQLEYELQYGIGSGPHRKTWKLERMYADALAAARSMNAKGFELMIEEVWASG